MSCECYQIGGRFIAEDPNCPAHGIEAVRRNRSNETIISELRSMLSMAYECVEKGRNDEALLHIGMCEVKVNRLEIE